MAAISISAAHGFNEFQPASYTVGVLAPGAGDFEFRWNQTDTASNPVTRLDAIKALDAFKRALEMGTFVFTSGTPEAFP
jgi:hypothetical protein